MKGGKTEEKEENEEKEEEEEDKARDASLNGPKKPHSDAGKNLPVHD